jgi:hypothetical protein
MGNDGREQALDSTGDKWNLKKRGAKSGAVQPKVEAALARIVAAWPKPPSPIPGGMLALIG